MTEKKYYGELVLGVVVKSQMELDKFQGLFVEDELRAELILKLLDGSQSTAEVLSIYAAEWEGFE